MNVEHFDWHDAVKMKDPEGKAPDWLVPALEQYFDHFAKPAESGSEWVGYPCLKCGNPLTGVIGCFRWGIVHGEGHCASCGWPARAYHSIKDPNGEEFLTVTMVLQYHPDFVEVKEQA